jgi:hypothetical protein
MTGQRLVQLQRRIKFERIPCVGEWLRFERSGLLPHEVTEITHNERGGVEVVIGLQKDDSGKILFHETAEYLRADVDDLVKGGWKVVSEKSNHYWGKHRGKRIHGAVSGFLAEIDRMQLEVREYLSIHPAQVVSTSTS